MTSTKTAAASASHASGGGAPHVASSTIPVYQALADAFAAEGVDHHFLLMGHGQMRWAIALDELPGVRSIDARHEHCAVLEAVGYHLATGKVGVASTTSGPGFTQIMTGLTSAVRGHIPLVVFAADGPLKLRWYNQGVDQATLTRGTGAHFIAAHNPTLMRDYVQEAFYVARTQRRPVVLSVPYDLLEAEISADATYVPSSELVPDVGPMPPSQRDIDRVAERLSAAQRPIIIAGRGAIHAGAREAIEQLAERTGALLATTLPARGLFDGHPFNIGVSGGYSAPLAQELFAEADFVLAIGARLTHFTQNGGKLFSQATIAQVDHEPVGFRHGLTGASLHVRGDAKLAAEALVTAITAPTASTFRSHPVAQSLAEKPLDWDPMEYDIGPGLVDPRDAIRALDDVVPKDWDIVSGSGHSAYFYTHLRGRSPEQFMLQREFGAIGSSLAMAIGVAAARGNGKVLLIDGDGGLLMHAQEFESIARQGIQLAICALNDGGYGAEFHRLRFLGIDERMATFGRPDFASIARGFGLRGATITDASQFAAAFEEYQAGSSTMIWDTHISEQVTAPRRRTTTE